MPSAAAPADALVAGICGAERANLTSPPLPIDDSDGGCDTLEEKEHRAWASEHPGLNIARENYISDNGREIYNLLRSRGIETGFYTSVT
jgi:hypothetical protein